MALYLTGFHIENNVPDPENIPPRYKPSADCLQFEEQFVHIERFSHIVISAERVAEPLAAGIIEGCKHQDIGIFKLSKIGNQRMSLLPGQHDIQQDDVWFIRVEHLPCFFRSERRAYRKPLPAKQLLNTAVQGLVVFYYQYSNGHAPAPFANALHSGLPNSIPQIRNHFQKASPYWKSDLLESLREISLTGAARSVLIT